MIIASQIGRREEYSLFNSLKQVECITDFSTKGQGLFKRRLTLMGRLVTAKSIPMLLYPVFYLIKNKPILYSTLYQLYYLLKIRKHTVVIGYARELFLWMMIYPKKCYILIQHDFYMLNQNSFSNRLNQFELLRSFNIVSHSEFSHDSIYDITGLKTKIIPPRFNVNYKEIKVVNIGRDDDRKGFGLFSRLAEDLAGDEMSFAAIGIKKVHSKHVKALGWLPYHELKHWLYTHRVILVFPSLFDGYGYVQNEVLASGGYVVSSTNCGLKEIPGLKLIANNYNEYKKHILFLTERIKNDPRHININKHNSNVNDKWSLLIDSCTKL